jgi:hypothetical protein
MQSIIGIYLNYQIGVMGCVTSQSGPAVIGSFDRSNATAKRLAGEERMGTWRNGAVSLDCRSLAGKFRAIARTEAGGIEHQGNWSLRMASTRTTVSKHQACRQSRIDGRGVAMEHGLVITVVFSLRWPEDFGWLAGSCMIRVPSGRQLCNEPPTQLCSPAGVSLTPAEARRRK